MPSATAAYRKDLAANGRPFGEHDGGWINVAVLAEQAARLLHEDRAEAERLLHAAADAAAATLGHEAVRRLSEREWGTEHDWPDVLTLLAMSMHDAGAFALATALVDSVVRVLQLRGDVHLGRMMAQRARVAYLTGETEFAEEVYHQVAQLAEVLESAELRARAELGFGALAQLRGNTPESFAFAGRGLTLADKAGIVRLRSRARYALARCTAVMRRFDDALLHGWEHFSLAHGDPIEEAGALQTLGQIFLELGDRDSARSAFSAVLTEELPARILLPALGGFALTSIEPRRRAKLDWAIAEVTRFRSIPGLRFLYAAALIECAHALSLAGRAGEAEPLRTEAVALAQARRFHELEFRADEITSVAPVSPQAGQIVEQVRELEPRQLPRHVRLAAAGAT